MRLITLSLIFVSQLSFASKEDFRQKIDSILLLSKSDMEASIKVANDFLTESLSGGTDEAKVQANFTLGYILKQNGDYGKAIIYYLEAIRYAEQANYEGVNNTLISLHKNCGVIFRRFNAFGLAKEYYYKGMELADKEGDIQQMINLKYNLSGILLDEEDHEEAINTLEDLLTQDITGSKYFDILNRLSFAYIKTNDFVMARKYLNEILAKKEKSPTKLVSYAYQNLGSIKSHEGNYSSSDSLHSLALKSIKLMKEPPIASVFEIYFDAARNYVAWNKPEQALKTFAKAEELIVKITQLPKYFEIYKAIADVHFKLGNFQEAKKYEDYYSESVNTYLLLQEEIQQADKQFNMDLITKRYFDEVAKQEQIASILFYSKLISGSLLALLLFSVGYNWYQKVRMRRSIVRELVDLKIID